jgi:membrane protease YdiL (CAAX protease family)
VTGSSSSATWEKRPAGAASLPLLQRRYSALAAALLVTPIWAFWHLPFFTITTYRDFAPPAYIGFVFGLRCGSIWWQM